MKYYKGFAEIYNEKWKAFSIDQAGLVKKYLNDNGIKIKNILDACCGTGNFLQHFNNPVKKFGFDISEDMLVFAKNNCPDAMLSAQNMLDFKYDQKFDLITCNFDSINHLKDDKEWTQFFKNVYNHLNTNGLFIFDFNTTQKMNVSMMSLTSSEDFENVQFGSAIEANKILIKFKLFILQKNGLYKKIDFEQVESLYSGDDVVKMLKTAGFKDYKFTNNSFIEVSDLNKQRLFVICVKNK